MVCYVAAMNYGPSILDFLSQSPDLTEVLLAPGARPMRRDQDGMSPIGDDPLTEQDVRDTLSILIAHTKVVNSGSKNGVFSFGMPQRGRFRVSFMTQRGTPVASVMKVPSEVPKLADLMADPAEAEQVQQKFLSFRTGLLLIIGDTSLAANIFTYALLRAYSETLQRAMFIIEPSLTFLMRHQRSLVLQCEIGIDVEDVGQGLRAALHLNPDLIYIRDITAARDLELLSRAVQSQVFTVATIPILDAATLLPHGREDLADQHHIRGLWHLDYAGGKKLRVLME